MPITTDQSGGKAEIIRLQEELMAKKKIYEEETKQPIHLNINMSVEDLASELKKKLDTSEKLVARPPPSASKKQKKQAQESSSSYESETESESSEEEKFQAVQRYKVSKPLTLKPE